MSKNNPAKYNTRYEVITQEDPEYGDIILPIPEEVLRQMGWKEGDEIDVGVNEDGSIFLKKK
jgi:hypothetical protein